MNVGSDVFSNSRHAPLVLTLSCLLMCFWAFGPPEHSVRVIGSSLESSAYRFESPSPIVAFPLGNRPLNNLVIIVMENRNYADIIGNPSAPYLNRLANDYGLARNYHNVSNYRSLPNYLALFSGN